MEIARIGEAEEVGRAEEVGGAEVAEVAEEEKYNYSDPLVFPYIPHTSHRVNEIVGGIS
ncbi:MAG: hypothetical protein F6J92_10090 [Symploca sp. SIO1A3]|nr:hypothetical protein [Symploca sp. SIO1A3]